MNVYIGGAKDYSAMQGPCAEGYHIPLQSEWTRLIEIGITVGAWTASGGDDFKTYLKLPYNGCRLQSDGSVQLQDSYGYYWGSTAADSIAKGFRIYVGSGIIALGWNRRASGYGIRPFKDNPVVPDNTWTTLKSGTGSAGIYWNSALGLISVSPDGSNWITIADKNLGATTVYSDGATLSEANCGKYYQRGNNYGFPFTGSVTTSSSQVNAGSYGPGNYYSSSTFITAGNADWSSVQNDNLRGGVTGIVSPAPLKNAYIGEYIPPYLCFTANTASSTIQLTQTGAPTAVSLETSTDGSTWSTYTIGNTITLSNIGDKVYWRNTSTTDTGFSTGTSNYYQFVMTGSISASGDANYLLNKNSTTTLSGYCYERLFRDCTSLVTAPKLLATTLGRNCYEYMFYGCTNLNTLPNLPATNLPVYAYRTMFYNCTKIKLSTTQTGEYQTAYRIPTTGTGTDDTYSLYNMFSSTGGTFTGTPTINTTYYTSNTVV